MAVEVAQAQTSAVSRADARAEAWWVFPAIPMLAAAIAFAWTLYGELQRLYGMTGSAWDFAYDQQVIWNVAQGQGFYSSFARANFLGIHFELIFFALAAVERFWPSPTVLLIFSSAGLAATAPAAYLFFRALLPKDRPESAWLAVALAAPIPFWYAIQEAARDFFHPENMALAFALLAAWAGLRGRRILMWTFCLLTLTCKEDQIYTVGVVALLMSQYGAPEVKKHWRFILYLAAGWFLVGTGIVQQHFRNGGYTDFVYYRWLLGLDDTMPVSPLTVLETIFRPGAVVVFAVVFASVAAMPMFAPRWLLLVVPPYLADVLSGHNPQNVLSLHYVLLLLFPFIVAAGVGARNYLQARQLKPAWALLVIIPPLVLGFAIGRFPPALRANAGLYSHPNLVAQLQTATAMIPADAAVNADDGLAVWLANRHTINDFPDRLEGSSYVVIDRQAYLSGPTKPDERQAALDALPTSGRTLLYDDGRFQVWSPVGGD
ncbi:MAG TPA: DUF2079 domain-containing protein [Candidatus Dormibacteraeota bacterium]|nr:DUF2079 domain-containing protein [Candidatus Dormibacteraeota bacterium]